MLASLREGKTFAWKGGDKMFIDPTKYYERVRCRACREWMEPGFDNRISEGEDTYHWKCYWQIVWPEKARKSRELKVGVK